MIKENPLLLDMMIERVFEEFDWESTLKMMQAIEWTYATRDGEFEVVTMEAIKETASEILRQATVYEGDYIECGGFRAFYQRDKVLELVFVGERSPMMPFQDTLEDVFLENFIIGENVMKAVRLLDENTCDYQVITPGMLEDEEYDKCGIVLVEEKGKIMNAISYSYLENNSVL